MSTRKPSSIATKIVATFAIAALSLSAHAKRYWHGTNATALYSDEANWGSGSSSSTTGASAPDSDTTDEVIFRKSLVAGNNKTVFDGAYTVGAYVYMETQTPSSDPFVWSATDPTYGLTMTANEWRFGRYTDRTPTWLQIDSGTYSAKYLRFGYDGSPSNLQGDLGIVLKGGNRLRTGEAVGGIENGDLHVVRRQAHPLLSRNPSIDCG